MNKIFKLFLISALSSFGIFLGVFVHAQDMSDCKQCHVSTPKLDGKVQHPAVGMGCAVCHSSAHSSDAQNPKGLSAQVPELCYNCHDKSKFDGPVVHMPIGAGMCSSCHDPHSSDNEKLLLSPQPDVCYSCHQPYEGKIKHAPVVGGMCTHCHGPHSGVNSSLLRKPLKDVCLECHEDVNKKPHVLAGEQFGTHPLFGETDPLREGKSFSCVSCHNPHGSDFGRLYRYEASTPFGLCLYCHEK